MPIRTRVYIDGFNLYYGALDKTPFKWLDIVALCRDLLPQNQIERVHYFTALVSDTAADRSQSSRQQAYLRALRTLPEVEITLGSFLTNDRRMSLATGSAGDIADPNVVTLVQGGPTKAIVTRTEEKGSDVNLATRLVAEASLGLFDVAAVLSTDSDLALAIEVVQTDFNKPVGVLFPAGRFSVELNRTATFRRNIERRHLRRCQLPDPMRDAKGPIAKPRRW
jgi:hypothetical protein